MPKFYYTTEFIPILNKKNNSIIALRWKNGRKLGEEHPIIINFKDIDDIITYYDENYNTPLVYKPESKKYTKANSMLFFDDNYLIIKVIYYKYDNRSYQFIDANMFFEVKKQLIKRAVNKFTKGDFLFE